MTASLAVSSLVIPQRDLSPASDEPGSFAPASDGLMTDTPPPLQYDGGIAFKKVCY